MTRAFVLGTLLLAVFAMAAAAQDSPKPVDLAAEYQSLISTERAFAKKSVDTNPKEAFLAFLADDGVLYAPGPVNGKEVWAKRPTPTFVLDWWPTYADISRSADLGWTTGPWDLALPDGRKLHGYFSTVWRKQADGTWRFVTDMGASMPEAVARGGEPGPLDPAKLEKFSVPADPKEAEGALLDTDKALGEAAGKGVGEAYGSLLAKDIRLMREGHAPFVGKEAAALRLSEEKGAFSSKPVGGGSAKAGDLGYVYGSWERQGEKPEKGNYLRVWKREPGDTWKLALEVLSPLPPG